MVGEGVNVFSLADKVAIVTGAASGIGLATARRLAAAGASVVRADIAEGGETDVRCDVTDERGVEALIADTVDHHGQLDIMVNNAGILGPGRGVLTDSMDDVRSVLEVNLLGVMYGVRHAGRVMAPGGVIINTASLAGLTGFPGLSAYGASKHAVVGLTKHAAIELGSKGIRVNCVCPTGVSTPMVGDEEIASHWATRVQSLANQHVLRLATAEEVAAAIHYLASDEAAMVNGHALAVDGGMAAGLSTQLIEHAVGEPIHDDDGILE